MSAVELPFSADIITRRFAATGAKAHTGVDFGVGVGTPCPSAAAGTVQAVGEGRKYGKADLGFDYGNWVAVRDGNGYTHFYAHLSAVLVEKGDDVDLHQVIAKSGRSGGPISGPHLHWSVMKTFWSRSTLVDPLAFTAKHPATQLASNGTKPALPKGIDMYTITMKDTGREYLASSRGVKEITGKQAQFANLPNVVIEEQKSLDIVIGVLGKWA